MEDTDNANVVARSEVLARIANGSNTWVITYPEALFEKVPSQKILVENTFRLDVGKSYSIDFINELLLEYQFERLDFVYEPGQFAIRGGIIDVFSYANDFPFRIEFFGDEVESIRTFDAANQLSLSSHKFLSILPNIQGQMSQNGVASIFSFIGENSTVWLSSFERIESALHKEFEKAKDVFNKLTISRPESSPEALFLSPIEFLKNVSKVPILEFGPDYHFTPSDKFVFNFIVFI